MSEREYHFDVCPECNKQQDSSEKKLFQCRYCERWFCERHLKPRLAVIRDFNKIIKDKEWRTMVEEDWKREDGHPDYAYTNERFDELKIEKEIMRAKMNAFLENSGAYRKPTQKETKGSVYSLTPIHIRQPKRNHKKVGKAVLVISVIIVALLAFALFTGLIKLNVGTPFVKQWQTPSTQELKTWLGQDDTNALTPNDISNRTFFAETLANRARAKDWKMGIVYIRGYEVNFNVAFDHVFNAIVTKEGLVYITPDFDTVWSNINHEQIAIGGTYSFGMGGFFYGYVEEIKTLLDY